MKGVLAEESILPDGKVDLGKAELLAYDGVGKQPCYRLLGEKVGDAFKAGLALKQALSAVAGFGPRHGARFRVTGRGGFV